MKRSLFNLSHYRLMSFHAGELVPVSCVEVLPGDTFDWDLSMLMRAAPLAAPLMHPVYVEYAAFFVPNRIVWDDWEDFISDMGSGLTVPTRDVRANSWASWQLANFLGMGGDPLPTAVGSEAINAMPLRGYNLIWNEFFRDQDIDTPLTVATGAGPDGNDYTVRRVRKEKDYFSTLRAQPQDGSAAVVAVNSFPYEAGVIRTFERSAAGAATPVQVNQAGGAQGTDFTIYGEFNVAAWRTAMMQQKMREFQNRFGHRYYDRLRRLGVTPSDARLQRPELLGRGRSVLQLSEVLTTSEGATGEMAGHGITAMRNKPWRRFFEEHGHVICLAWVRPRQVWAQASDRNFFRSTWSDYWQPETEILGEQPVLMKEIYLQTAAANLNVALGYQQRHDEYRRHLSSVGGEFLESTLNTWHWAEFLSGEPTLNSSFIEDNPSHRIFQDTSGNVDDFRAMIYHRVAARRLVAKHARQA